VQPPLRTAANATILSERESRSTCEKLIADQYP
jgi:hypothetical protein